jgi:hypothetical protein
MLIPRGKHLISRQNVREIGCDGCRAWQIQSSGCWGAEVGGAWDNGGVPAVSADRQPKLVVSSSSMFDGEYMPVAGKGAARILSIQESS